MLEMMRPQRSHTRYCWRTRVRAAFVLFGFFATAGMLIWGKLRLVGDVPRTAWAEPDNGAAVDRAVADAE
ncbi:MAG: hypothetical protein AAGK04_09195 [Planctomycetota bacterium]